MPTGYATLSLSLPLLAPVLNTQGLTVPCLDGTKPVLACLCPASQAGRQRAHPLRTSMVVERA